jgi:N-acetylmuramoyl-L-alanine amidase
MSVTQINLYPTFMLALCSWREARGESSDAQLGVIHTILNRAAKPSWWGRDVVSVVLKPEQFSSFNVGDPNATKFPVATDAIWQDILGMAIAPGPDNTAGATHYFDDSMKDDPPSWAREMTPTVKLGALNFYK